MKLVAGVVGNDFVAGLLVSNLSFFVALTYIYRWARREFNDEVAGRTVFYLASAPTAVFFSAMYTESLFVLLVAATFFYAGDGKWARAAITGAVAAATRNTGVLMTAVIAFEGWHQAGVHFWPRSCQQVPWLQHVRRQIRLMLSARASLIAAAFVPSGLMAYMVYLSAVFDDPLAFIHEQETWGRETSASAIINIVGHTHELLRIGPQPWLGQINVVTLMDLVLTLAFVPVVAMVVVRMRPAYVVFTLSTFLVPLSTGSVGSMSRYALMLIPCYLLLACWGRRPWVDRVVVGSFLPFLTYFAVLFSHWYVAG